MVTYCYRAISSGKWKWSTISSIGRSRNKQGKCLRSHLEESEEKQNISKAYASRPKHGRAGGRAQQTGCADTKLSHIRKRGRLAH